MHQTVSIRVLLEDRTDGDFDFDRVIAEFTETRGTMSLLRDLNTGEELFRAAIGS